MWLVRDFLIASGIAMWASFAVVMVVLWVSTGLDEDSHDDFDIEDFIVSTDDLGTEHIIPIPRPPDAA
jgi:hypothetical protein